MFDIHAHPAPTYSAAQKHTTDNTRTDTLSAKQIDTALMLQATLGTTCAIEYLNGNGISHQTIVRVLSNFGAHRPIVALS